MEKINCRLRIKSRQDVLVKVNPMSKRGTRLWLINEFHNVSKHQELITKEIVVIVPPGKITKVALLHPVIRKPMRQEIIDYLTSCLKMMENVIADARSKI